MAGMGPGSRGSGRWWRRARRMTAWKWITPRRWNLGHLGIEDPHELAQLALLEADQPAQGTPDGDGGAAPQPGASAFHSTWASLS